ncbi:MAG TPA: adenosine deaminase [Candidatus Angelobacter sp.]|nr:adenosine deaminase [Candidatus Angelobacter sp.]
MNGTKKTLRGLCGFLVLAITSLPVMAQQPATSPELKTSRYFESVRRQPSLLMDFLRRMPKGGDLHNHLSGAIYAESFIRWAAEDGLCVDRSSNTLVGPPCDASRPPASAVARDNGLYTSLLDAFSMRGWNPGRESGHDHFFATFGKFGAASNNHTAEMIAEVRSTAAAENVQYLELMFNPDGGQAAKVGAAAGWNEDLGKLREQLLSGGLPEIVATASHSLDQIEAKESEELHCQTPQADPGCRVQARYLYQVARGLPKEMVFAQILSGFEMAARDPRVVGLNLVMAEDWYVPLHDFNAHMKMLDFLHGVYPKVHITLHAGELTRVIAPPEDLFHIRASIERGHAERIGHGVDVMEEADPLALLRDMAKKKVLVEVCLTSNDVILGVSGDRHPLPMYLRFGVPVALATDDPGVSRSNLTHEYQRAVETYNLSYAQLKQIVRAGLSYSFLPGESLWNGKSRNGACASDNPKSAKPSPSCRELLSKSEKAKAQWELEKAFSEFEASF